MRENIIAFEVIAILERSADQSDPARRLHWNIIRQAVEDLQDPGVQMDAGDYPSELYFQSSKFVEHADACGLDPEYVTDVLEKHNLLRDGRRVHEVTEFIAA